jgi:hypothetical protein
VTVPSARCSARARPIAARVPHRPPGARPGHDHDPDPAARKADEPDRRAQPAASHRTHPPAIDVDPGADQPTTPWLPQPDSQRPPAAPRQRDTRSLLPRGPDQRWPRDQVPDDPLARPGVAFLGRAAVDETRVRRPVRRHDHVEEVEFQPAAHRGLPRERDDVSAHARRGRPAGVSPGAPLACATARCDSALSLGRDSRSSFQAGVCRRSSATPARDVKRA